MEADASSTLNVLVVSHGGLIKELVSFFVRDLNCKIPSGGEGPKKSWKQTSPNAGISVYEINTKNGGKHDLKCIKFNDADHMRDLEVLEVSVYDR